MAYQNLRFFDNTSNELNLTYNSSLGYLTGSSFLPEVSVGLYETLNLYVLEEVRDDLNNPRFVQPIGANTDSAKITFEFVSEYTSSDDIFLYSGKIVENDFEVVVDKTQSSLMQSKTKYSGAIDSDGFKIIPLNMAALQPSSCIANIALSSSDEKFHIRTLIVSVEEDGVKTKVAEIKVYGETVGEDDRLKDLLTNMALNLDENDYLIFRDSDIKDLGVDYILLNEKRKELLLQASTIKPFIGTYKALLNVIDFFGYSNVSLREYWLNINEKAESFGKLIAVAVPNQTEVGFLAKKSRNTNLPSSNQKKTSRFSLAYRLNTPTGKLNEFDLPEVEEVSDFSPDEILIKLYALKRKLQREYLPLQAKIVDITGEGDYFDSVSQRTWSNQHQIHAQTAGQDVHYDILPEIKTIYLEDLRKVDHRLKGFKQDIRVFDKTNRNEIEESITKFYKSYHDEDMSSHNTIAGIPVGAPIVLRATSLKDTWDDAEFTFIDANDTDSDANVLHSNGQSTLQDPYLTWDDWWKRSVYEVEWIITGPRKFKKTIRGPIDEWYTLPLILPYSGEYSIDAAFWDLYNVRSISFNRKITVESKNIQIYGLYQKLTPELNWSDYKYKWNEAGSSWEYGRENLSLVEDSISTYYLSSDRANYLNDDEEGKEFSVVRRFADSNTLTGFNETTGPYQWKSLRKHTWKDGDSTSWNQTRIGPDLNSSFKVELAGSLNGSITISQIDTFTGLEIFETYFPTSTYPTTNTDFVAWENIKLELNSLNANQWPIFTKFNWNPVYVDTDNNITNGFNGADVCNYMLVVSKQANESYDFHNVTSTTGTINPSSFVKYQVYNPNYNDAYTIQDHEKISLLNHMTFSYDISEMPGIVSQKWRLINNSINKEDIYYDNQWLTYLFDEKGEYTVELELTDVNGNRNITKKNILTIK